MSVLKFTISGDYIQNPMTQLHILSAIELKDTNQFLGKRNDIVFNCMPQINMWSIK